MTMLPADAACVTQSPGSPPVSGLERVLRWLSVFTMLMTVPQVLTIWVERDAGGVSLVSWVAYLISACLWFVYGLRKRDKTIYLACVDSVKSFAAFVIRIIVHR